MLRRIAWGIGCLLGGILLGVPLWIQTHRSDLPTPGDDDLMRQEPGLEADDGFEDLQLASRAATGLVENDARLRAMRERKAFEPDLLEDLLRRNAKALHALERGLASGNLRLPSEYLGFDGTSDFDKLLLDVQLLVKLVTTEAQLLLRRGDRERAFERALFGLRVGRRLSQLQDTTLLSEMVAVSCQGIGTMELERLLREVSVTPAQSRELAARIDSYRIPALDWRNMWAGEYRALKLSTRETFFEASDGALLGDRDFPESRWLRWIPDDYLFQPNRTLSDFAAFYREQQRRADLPCDQTAAASANPLDRTRLLWRLLGPNPAGALILRIATPNLARFDMKRCGNDSKLGLVQLAIAVDAYVGVEGALPDRLDQLVPAYLDAVPLDRFDGAPLRYSKADAIVYSIGDDLVDSGGSDPPMQTEGAEPTIRVAF